MQGSDCAAFHPKLHADAAEAIIRKGTRSSIHSYSTFFENDRKTPTGLVGLLRERGVTHVRLTGLALDFCVAFSAMDAADQGFLSSFKVTFYLSANLFKKALLN